MESLLSRYRSPLVLMAVLVAQIVGLASQVRRTDFRGQPDGHHVRIARVWTAYTIVPVERLFSRMGHGVRAVWNGYIDLRHVRQHDKDLQYQIDQLRLQQAALREDARQGQRLEHLLGFKQQYIGKTVAAQVIGTGGGDRSRLLILDKGSNDGLRPDMAVITPDGIVGKLRDVFPSSSQLLLINDTSSGVGVILANVRSRGILRGTPVGGIQIGTLLPDDRIKAGETVVTSGGDRVYPRGLSVGTVLAVKPDPDHQPYTAIAIQPAANLERLEEVLVITDVGAQLASTGISGSDDSDRRASEIVAERLPGLKDTSAVPGSKAEEKPTAAEGASTPAPAAVHPAPAVHPDRYSPGAAPPAAELHPGERAEPAAPPAVAEPRR